MIVNEKRRFIMFNRDERNKEEKKEKITEIL